MPPVSLQRGQQRREVVGQRLGARGELAEVGDDRLALGQRRAADVGGVAERLAAPGCRPARTGPSSLMKRLIDGASAPRSVQHRRHLVRQPAEARHRRACSSRRKAGSLLRCSARGRSSARPWPALVDVGLRRRSRRPAPRSRASGARIVSPSRARFGEHLVLVGEDRAGPCRSPSAPGWRCGSAWRRSPPRPARPVPSSLRMIDRRWR